MSPVSYTHLDVYKRQDTCATNRKTLRIAGDDKPAEVVRSRFMKLNADHIRFVLKCLAENSNPIRNMKQYLLASLYNACLLYTSCQGITATGKMQIVAMTPTNRIYPNFFTCIFPPQNWK